MFKVMYKKYQLKNKTRKQRVSNKSKKKTGGAKKSTNTSTKTRRNSKTKHKTSKKGGKLPEERTRFYTGEVEFNIVPSDIDRTKDGIIVRDKRMKNKWNCTDCEINDDGMKDCECAIPYGKDGKIERKVAFGLEYQDDENLDEGMDLVLQNYNSKGELTNKRWECNCDNKEEGTGDIDLDCKCDIVTDNLYGVPHGEWNVKEREPEEDSESEDDYDDYDALDFEEVSDFDSPTFAGPKESKDSLQQKIQNLNRTLSKTKTNDPKLRQEMDGLIVKLRNLVDGNNGQSGGASDSSKTKENTSMKIKDIIRKYNAILAEYKKRISNKKTNKSNMKPKTRTKPRSIPGKKSKKYSKKSKKDSKRNTKK